MTGIVYLVGSGPGAADLLTIRAQRVLASADVVVADRLGAVGVLDELPPAVEIIDVGKVPGRPGWTQAAINALVVEHARRGRRVVRLKGGDPFVFGRGGEEQLACTAAGIPVEVVPGISSALSAPALAGVPLTHRGSARGVLVVHGHDPLPDSVAQVAVSGEVTLVVLMGVARLREHVDLLLDAGAPASTPVAVVERGSLPDQRVTRARLDTIADAAQERGVTAPAVIVVGAVAAEGFLDAGHLGSLAPDLGVA